MSAPLGEPARSLIKVLLSVSWDNLRKNPMVKHSPIHAHMLLFCSGNLSSWDKPSSWEDYSIRDNARAGTITQIGTPTRVATTARVGTITQLGTATQVATTARVGTKLSIYSFHFVTLLVISGMVSHRFNFDSYLEISNWDIRAEG